MSLKQFWSKKANPSKLKNCTCQVQSHSCVEKKIERYNNIIKFKKC